MWPHPVPGEPSTWGNIKGTPSNQNLPEMSTRMENHGLAPCGAVTVPKGSQAGQNRNETFSAWSRDGGGKGRERGTLMDTQIGCLPHRTLASSWPGIEPVTLLCAG